MTPTGQVRASFEPGLRQLEFRWRRSEVASPRQITDTVGRWLLCRSPSPGLPVSPMCVHSVEREVHPQGQGLKWFGGCGCTLGM